jgi:hypothetical protein
MLGNTKPSTLQKSVLLASNEFQVGGKQNIDPKFSCLKTT